MADMKDRPVFHMFTAYGTQQHPAEGAYYALCDELEERLPEPEAGFDQSLSARFSNAVCNLVIEAQESAVRRYGATLAQILAEGPEPGLWISTPDPASKVPA